MSFLHIRGKLDLEVRIDDTIEIVPFYAADDLEVDCVLDEPWLINNQATMDYHHLCVGFDG